MKSIWCKFVLILCSFASAVVLNGCVSTALYKLDKEYSLDPDDPERSRFESQIQQFLRLVGNYDDPTDKYLLNGEYLLLRIKNRNEKKIDEAFDEGLCDESSTGKECTRIGVLR
jgi:hypothetical protein